MIFFSKTVMNVFRFVILTFSVAFSGKLNKEFDNLKTEPQDENIFHELTDNNVYGSDMILDNEQIQAGDTEKRKLVTRTDNLWPLGIVPYKIIGFKHPKARYYIELAIQHWQTFTCLQFKDITSDYQLQLKLRSQLRHVGYIAFGPGSGCGSMVGCKRRHQPVRLLEPFCLRPGTVVHEIGHAIGFFHEQERIDRNKHLEIFMNHIKKGKEINFRLSYTDTRGVPYDLGSTMHYGPYFFSKDNKQTIRPLDSNLEFLMGRREGLSFYDIMVANRAYKCSESCKTTLKCVNDGFVSKDCKCFCPAGLSGETCEEVDTKDCGFTVDLADKKKITITSPGYPNKYKNTLCSWFVKAKPGKRIRTRIQIEDMPKEVYDGEEYCYHSIEVRYNLVGQEGPRYCGKAETHFLPLSTGNTVTLLFDSEDTEFSGTGFQAELYVDDLVTRHVIFQCNFEDTDCGFSSPQTSPYTWKRTSWKPFGPTKSQSRGTFFLAEASLFKWKRTTSFTKGPLIYPLKTGKHCIVFWYYALGFRIGELYLYISYVTETQNNLLWSVSKVIYRGIWECIKVEVDILKPFHIVFGLKTLKIYDNFAVDDILVLEGFVFVFVGFFIMEITSLRASISHPNEHKLRFTTVGKTPYSLERSHTLAGCVPFAREASFEIERPQSHGRSNLVINVATSFVRHHEHNHTRHPTKIPAQTFPALPSITHKNQHTSDSDKISVLRGKGLMSKSQFKRPKNEKLNTALPVNLSDEKQDWIARWIQNTNKALESEVETLPNIREQ